MDRRTFLRLSGLSAAGFAAATAALPFQNEKSGMKITGVRLVTPKQKHPLPAYTVSKDAWSTGGVEVASPMSMYPEYKAMRSLFMPDAGMAVLLPAVQGTTLAQRTECAPLPTLHGYTAGRRDLRSAQAFEGCLSLDRSDVAGRVGVLDPVEERHVVRVRRHPAGRFLQPVLAARPGDLELELGADREPDAPR